MATFTLPEGLRRVDIDKNKIVKDLAEAIFTEPNSMVNFADVPEQGVEIKMGPILDGAPDHLREFKNM